MEEPRSPRSLSALKDKNKFEATPPLVKRKLEDRVKQQQTEEQCDRNKVYKAKSAEAAERRDAKLRLKQEAARKMAGGEIQGKEARELLVQRREEQRLAELEEKLVLQQTQAAARAQAIKEEKILSAKKSLAKQEIAKQRAAFLLEQKQDETAKALFEKQERAAMKAQAEAHAKILKAQADLHKVETVRAKALSCTSSAQKKKQSDTAKHFFGSPHDCTHNNSNSISSSIHNESSSQKTSIDSSVSEQLPHLLDLSHVDHGDPSLGDDDNDDRISVDAGFRCKESTCCSAFFC